MNETAKERLERRIRVSTEQELRLHKTLMDGVHSVDEVIEILNSIESHGTESCEYAHQYSDLFLLEALKLLGQQELVDAYNRVRKEHEDFWYA